MAEPSASARLRKRLTTLDSTFLYGETANSPLHIGSVIYFDGKVPLDRLVQSLDERIHVIPRYRQRLAEVPFTLNHATLEDAPDFRTDNHVTRHTIPAGLGEMEALEHALRLYQPLMDRTRPLWEILLFEGWPGGNTCLISKVHHALVDGVSGIELTKALFDFSAEAKPPPPPDNPWRPAGIPGAIERLIAATRDLMIAQVNGATQVAELLARDPQAVTQRVREITDALGVIGSMTRRRIVATPWNAGPVTEGRRLAYSKMAFADYRMIRNAFGGTINDVVLTVLTEGAARYLKHHGWSTDGSLVLGCPVNVRRPEEQSDLGNRVSMMFPALPAEPTDVVARLKLVRDETERIKTEQAPQLLERLTSMGETLSPGLLALATRIGTLGLGAGAALVRMTNWSPQPAGFALPAPGINFIATNVPGVQVPQYLDGHLCTDQIGLLPLGGNMGYGVAILSYNQNLYFGMMSDPRLMPDVALMKSYVDGAFAELKTRSAAEARADRPTQRSRREPPGEHAKVA